MSLITSIFTEHSLSKNIPSIRFSLYSSSLKPGAWLYIAGQHLQHPGVMKIKVLRTSLTYVTVLTHPAWEAIAVVAGNQILAGSGIYTRFGLAFICIWKRERINSGKWGSTPTPTLPHPQKKPPIVCLKWDISISSLNKRYYLEHLNPPSHDPIRHADWSLPSCCEQPAPNQRAESTRHFCAEPSAA